MPAVGEQGGHLAGPHAAALPGARLALVAGYPGILGGVARQPVIPLGIIERQPQQATAPGDGRLRVPLGDHRLQQPDLDLPGGKLGHPDRA